MWLQVDVFAYGMVLYELLSQRGPFDNVQPPIKRNYEVRDGQRPALQAKETRSLIQLQDLMKLCWEKEAENRPKMNQVVEWIRAPEFERLRAEVTLREVKSISCTCVCRILPEYELQASEDYPTSQRTGAGLLYGVNDGLADFDESENDDFGTENARALPDDGGMNGNVADASIDLIVPNMLPSISMDSICIENLEGNRISNDGEDVYQFLPTKTRKGSVHGRAGSVNRGERGSFDRSGSSGPGGEWTRMKGTGGMEGKKFDPYTQIWMCGRDQRKGLLQIFTYNDGLPGNYVS